jgi:hypothetical protein
MAQFTQLAANRWTRVPAAWYVTPKRVATGRGMALTEQGNKYSFRGVKSSMTTARSWASSVAAVRCC